MVPVPLYPLLHIEGMPLREKAGIVPWRLRPFPHVEGFRHDKKAHFIRKLHKRGRGKGMGAAERVDPHLLQGPELPFKRLPVEGASQRPLVMMKAHSLQLIMPPVNEKPFVRGNPYLLEACADPLLFKKDSLPEKADFKCIESGLLRAPQMHVRTVNICSKYSCGAGFLFGNQPPRIVIQGSHNGAAVRTDALRLDVKAPGGRIPCRASRRSSRRNSRRRFGRSSRCFPLRLCDDVDSVLRNIAPAGKADPHVAVYPGARVPAAVRRAVPCADEDLVVPARQIRRDIKGKCRIAARTLPGLLPVDVDRAVHVDSFERKKDVPALIKQSFRAGNTVRAEGLYIPAAPFPVEIPRVADQPVVGYGHRRKAGE